MTASNDGGHSDDGRVTAPTSGGTDVGRRRRQAASTETSPIAARPAPTRAATRLVRHP